MLLQVILCPTCHRCVQSKIVDPIAEWSGLDLSGQESLRLRGQLHSLLPLRVLSFDAVATVLFYERDSHMILSINSDMQLTLC